METNNDSVKALLLACDGIDSGHWFARCPAHRGGFTSSLEIHYENGRLQLHCMCGCSPQKIFDAVQGRIDRLLCEEEAA
ncbi:MAG: hypothetical protein J0I24_14600 [Thiomonas arsenitoxydans]|uniref:Uncharacterized protein n=1 Tax=Thiomonas arsenitoxydans (strain DSM 22701 / CIP 110005 / 3As) TaxID=426114 RepID=A0A8I1MYX0_THIA3|nr:MULTISPECIES: hypothetical protein [Thiomonas]MBN8745512.1 hypothetical protein [Thiomonas arsenitoxydans]ODU96301.1 MAG: hypothetical protein ABT24_09555 [Thiomonas sp. SCN 64-16]